MTYNIHHANPPANPGKIDVDAIAQVIIREKADLVLLQEVDVHTNRSGSDLHESERIAALTGMHSLFFKSIDYDNGEYGIAILSKYSLKQGERLALPTLASTKGEPRSLAQAVIEINGKEMVIACTHLDAQHADTNRILQAAAIREHFKNEKRPIILGGDFNAEIGSPVLQILDAAFTRSCTSNCGFTIPADNPRKRIDFITYRGMKAPVGQAVVDEAVASDHRPVTAVFKLNQ